MIIIRMKMEKMEYPVAIVEADLSLPKHQRDILALTEAYARDGMGNGGPLPADVLERLIPGLIEHPTTIIFLAYFDSKAVGIATCFLGFSTFTARPLINIHDFAVLPEYRRKNIGRALLDAVADRALERGCSRITLEVQGKNVRARKVYQAAGFVQSVYGEMTGETFFYTKVLRESERE